MSFLGEDSSTIASLDKNATSMKTISTTGPGMLTKQIFAFLNSSSAEESKMRTVILKTSVFHCVPNTTQANLADEDSVALLKTQWLTPDSVAVHWWQKSWQAQV